MITYRCPELREYASALLDVLLRRVYEPRPGILIRLPADPLPTVESLGEKTAEVVWREAPQIVHDESGVTIPQGPAVLVHERPVNALLFTALRREKVPVAGKVGLIFTGSITPAVEYMPDGVRLRWRDPVRVDLPLVPQKLEPTIDHVDIRREHAVIVLNGFGDVTLDWSEEHARAA